MAATSKKKPTDERVSIENVEDSNVMVSFNPAEDVSYGREGMAGLMDSPFVFGAALLASLGGFSFGYDQGVISIINVMDSFHSVFPRSETAFGKSLMTAMLEFGAFIGCLFMPTLADKISRKKALIWVVVIFNIGAILQTAAPNYEVLVLGRTIGGIGVGTLAMGAPIYISEISPPNLRGTLLVLESISIVSGVVVSYFITYGTRHLDGEISFRLPFGLQMLGSTLLGVGIIFFPYSPRWLALVDRPDDALKSLEKLRRLPASDSRVQAEHAGILTEVRVQRVIQERRHPGKSFFQLELQGWLDLFRGSTKRRTVVAVGVAFFQQFSGINGFIYYAPTLFRSMGQTDEMSLIMSGVFNVIQLVAVAACFVVIDKVGRRPLAIWGALGGGIAWTGMAILTGIFSKSWDANPAAGWSAVALAFIFCFVFGISYSPLGWALPAEVYPNASRSKGVALASTTTWICNFIVGIATPPMVEGIGFGTYIFFGFWCYLGTVWAYFLVPETMGKTLEQMDEVFNDTAAQEEREIIQAQFSQEAEKQKDAEDA